MIVCKLWVSFYILFYFSFGNLSRFNFAFVFTNRDTNCSVCSLGFRVIWLTLEICELVSPSLDFSALSSLFFNCWYLYIQWAPYSIFLNSTSENKLIKIKSENWRKLSRNSLFFTLFERLNRLKKKISEVAFALLS